MMSGPISGPLTCEHPPLKALSELYQYCAGDGAKEKADSLLDSFSLSSQEAEQEEHFVRCPTCLCLVDIEKIRSGEINKGE